MSLSDLDLCVLASAAYTTDPTWHSSTVHACRTDAGPVTVVAFRGSASFMDWWTDLQFMPVRCRTCPKLGAMPSGFADSVDSVYDAIRRDLGERQYLLTGHSLGGAQAQIFAARATLDGHPPRRLVTYGAPRVGDLKGVIAMMPGLDYRNQRDPVPDVPLGYAHPRLVRQLGVLSIFSDPIAIDDHLVAHYLAAMATLETTPARTAAASPPAPP